MPGLTRVPISSPNSFGYGTLTLYGPAFQPDSPRLWFFYCMQFGPTTPNSVELGLGYIPFRSPLLRESSFLSLPAGTEMFQFPAFALQNYGFILQ